MARYDAEGEAGLRDRSCWPRSSPNVTPAEVVARVLDCRDTQRVGRDEVAHVWYQDMVDFAEGISDRAAGHSLSRALDGKGAFPAARRRRLARSWRGAALKLLSAGAG